MLAITVLFSCSNDMETVASLSQEENMPVDIAKEVKIHYSDSGKVKMALESSLMETYEGENPYVEMPDGIFVRFYDQQQEVKSTLRANYAISYEKTRIMEARHNVVVVNAKGETLNTEHLIWDQKEQEIRSDEFVKITTDDKILSGEGLVADEQMDNYTILKPRGPIYLDEDFGKKKSSDTLKTP